MPAAARVSRSTGSVTSLASRYATAAQPSSARMPTTNARLVIRETLPWSELTRRPTWTVARFLRPCPSASRTPRRSEASASSTSSGPSLGCPGSWTTGTSTARRLIPFSSTIRSAARALGAGGPSARMSAAVSRARRSSGWMASASVQPPLSRTTT